MPSEEFVRVVSIAQATDLLDSNNQQTSYGPHGIYSNSALKPLKNLLCLCSGAIDHALAKHSFHLCHAQAG
jgi:hypothetical protein